MRALFQIPARDPPTLEKKAKWSNEFHDFLSKCLEKNPKKRPSASEILQVCFSPPFTPHPPSFNITLTEGGDDGDDNNVASVCERL